MKYTKQSQMERQRVQSRENRNEHDNQSDDDNTPENAASDEKFLPETGTRLFSLNKRSYVIVMRNTSASWLFPFCTWAVETSVDF